MNTSIQACMDTTDWLKGIVQDQDQTTMMESAAHSPSTELISCSSHPSAPPSVLEHRLRPPQDHALKCPRCESTHTKFCYYNNYSLSQPRYFCKTCRRYWTKGGSLRNVPVGGGCRKNKRSGCRKPTMADIHHYHHHHQQQQQQQFYDPTATDLQLSSFPAGLLPPVTHLNSLSLSGGGAGGGVHRSNLNGFVECGRYTDGGGMIDVGGAQTRLFGGCYGDHIGLSPLGFSVDGGTAAGFAHATSSLMSSSMMMPFDGNDGDGITTESKPDGRRVLALEWPEQGSFGVYSGNVVGTWNAGNGHEHHRGGSSMSNPPLV